MTAADQAYFLALRAAVAAQLRAAYAGVSQDPDNWKSQEVSLLQEDMMARVQGRVSEKWAYTYLRSPQPAKLPRIDLLNLLSRYVGYPHWEAFKAAQLAVKPLDDEGPRPSGLRRWAWAALVTLPLLLVPWLVIALLQAPASPQVEFCFVDADLGTPLSGAELELQLLPAGESPLPLTCDSLGCVRLLRPQGPELVALVKSPYYRADTIRRRLSEEPLLPIPLQVDDYALMIHYFSTASQSGWQRRRQQLNEIFAEEARIYQLHPENRLGMALYNKQEFIDKLTLPVGSLRKLEVLQTTYDPQGRIRELRVIAGSPPASFSSGSTP